MDQDVGVEASDLLEQDEGIVHPRAPVADDGDLRRVREAVFQHVVRDAGINGVRLRLARGKECLVFDQALGPEGIAGGRLELVL